MAIDTTPYLGLPYPVPGSGEPANVPVHIKALVDQLESALRSLYVGKGEIVANVKDYGAVGDGVADDTTAVQNAINAAAGKTLLLPAGVYKITAQLKLPSNSSLLGAGASSILRFTWTDALSAAGSTYVINADPVNGNSRLSLRSLRFEGAGAGTPFGNATTPASGVLFRRGSDISVIDCTFYRIPGISLCYQGVQRVRIIGNHVHESGRDGIAGMWYTDNLTDVVVADNVIHSVGDDAIAVNGSTSGNPNNGTERPRRIVIANNTIYGQSAYYANGAGRGVFVAGCEQVTVEGNQIDSTFASGVHVQAMIEGALLRSRRVTVSGNTVARAGAVGDATQPRAGIRVAATDHVSVVGNTVAESVEHGILVLDSLGPKVAGNTVTACGTVLNSTTAHFGINLDGGSATSNVLHPAVHDNIVTGSGGGGIRCAYTIAARIGGNQCRDNGNAGDGTLAGGSGILLLGTDRFFLNDNTIYETRSGSARRQTFGIAVTAGPPSVLNLVGNYVMNHPQDLQLASVPTLLMRRGNHISDGTVNHYDQDINGVRRYSGLGTPEGAVAAPVGSSYFRQDGAAGTTFYVKESGTGSTGWVAK